MPRNINGDLLKSISIFGVVYIHAYSLIDKTSILIFIRDAYRFAVPCFIILWAYFLEKHFLRKENDKKKYLTTRFIHLLRVFLIWSLLYFLLSVNWSTLTFKNLFSQYFSGYGWSGQYFFIILFQLIIIYPLLRKIYHIKILRFLFIILTFILYTYFEFYFYMLPEMIVKLGYRPFYFWIIYVFIGISLARNPSKKISTIFLFSPIILGLELFYLGKYNFEHFDYITLGTLIFSSLFCAFFTQKKPLNYTEKINKLISFIGQNTLIIFVSNPLVIILLNNIIEHTGLINTEVQTHTWINILLSLVIVTIVFIATLLIIKVLKKTRLIKILG
ncbi:acyltransferase family protein [Maribacter zhoushanensis]|uniref:acyltransferase family protein n=1 Tax=Maribacter zhoushanensis TaxID=3030012 RepID=UPI003B8333D3